MSAFVPTIGQFDLGARGAPWVRWYKTYRRWLGIVIAVLLIIIIAAGGWAYWQSRPIPAHGGTVTEGMVGQPEHLNPLYSSSNPVDAELTPLIFRGLLKYNDKLQLVPDLASSWQHSDDGKTYTVTLGDNHWQDGAPVTAEDVAFTIHLTQDPSYHGAWSSSFTDVQVQVLDNHHAKLTLKEPYAPFGQNLTLGLLPEHLLRGKSAQQLLTDPFNLQPVGDGMLKFRSISVNPDTKRIDSMQMEVTHGYLGGLTFQFYQNLDAAMTDFKLGKLQTLGDVYSPAFDSLKSFPGKQQQEVTLEAETYSLVFNVQGAAKTTEVRQALAYALPKHDLLQQVFGEHVDQLDGPYASSFWAFSKRADTYNFDLGKAKDTLSGASDAPKQLTLLISDKDSNTQLAQRIEQAWSQLGITTHIVTKSSDEVGAMVKQQSGFDAVLLGEKSAPDPDRYVDWHSTQKPPTGLNFSGENNKRVDKALEDGRKDLTSDARTADYDTFQYYLAKDEPAIWLYQPHYVYVWSNKVHGVKLGPLWDSQDRFQGLDQWYVKTQRRG